MKEKFINLYMDFARSVANLSHAVRLKVGAVIVNDNTVIFGYNGTPSNWDNTCEDRKYVDPDAYAWLDLEDITEQYPFVDDDGKRYCLVTKGEVLHAESNAISKLAKSVVSGENAVMFLTHSPCVECAKLIYQAGIKTVYYAEEYRNTEGLGFLKKSDIQVIKKAP